MFSHTRDHYKEQSPLPFHSNTASLRIHNEMQCIYCSTGQGQSWPLDSCWMAYVINIKGTPLSQSITTLVSGKSPSRDLQGSNRAQLLARVSLGSEPGLDSTRPGVSKPKAMGQIWPPDCFVNKVLLAHSHGYLFTYRLWLFTCSNSRVVWPWPKILLSGSLQKEFPDPYPRPRILG